MLAIKFDQATEPNKNLISSYTVTGVLLSHSSHTEHKLLGLRTVNMTML